MTLLKLNGLLKITFAYCLLLAFTYVTDLCISSIHLANFLFLIFSADYSVGNNISEIMNIFVSSFKSLFFFLSLSYFTELIRTSRIALNKLKVMNLFVLFLILRGKYFNFSPLSESFAPRFLLIPLIGLKYSFLPLFC